jgi:hypothetical protein
MQVCSAIEYEHVFQRLKTIPSDVKHLVVQLGKCPFMAISAARTSCLPQAFPSPILGLSS